MVAEAEYTMTNRVGQHFGNYELVQLLGRGGQASVYLGKHRYLNSYAALKVLHATLQPGDEYKFTAEAQRLVDLQHPNIVRLLDFGIENGTPVLIMDYAPRGSLRQHYSQGTQISLTTVVDFVMQIALALQYAHNHNIIHCDVKPENILLNADNRLLLSDFGLSLLTPSSHPLSTQDPAGTARYMAPEQLRGKPGFASDQYALAVMVYEWLCGAPPFCGNVWAIWQQHMYSDPPPLRPLCSVLPLRLEQVVLRSLAKKPQDRFVSVQAFALALTRASEAAARGNEQGSQVTAPLQTRFAAPFHHVAPPKITQAPVPPKPSPASALENQNRVRMLKRLRRAYGEMMSQSLQGAAWLELGIAEKPDAVQNATNLVLHVESRAVHHLPPGTSMTQAYDEAEHELLILGEPGAGKSTLLLDLAQQLLVRAEQDQRHPLPVILPLSSWAIKRPKLEEWIVEQMAQIYDVPRKLSLQWVEEDHILPLLDGLDEMEEMARPACIATINAYHRDHLAKLVVCSRTTEYEAAASCHRLALQGAVVVQPLTHEDVQAYLVRVGQPLTDLRSALKKNAALHTLSTTPLMLNILTLTYQGTAVRDLPNRESLLQKLVWDDYVQRMVARKGNSKRYPLERTRAWLSYLAQQMREHNQTVFYLEHLQPSFLDASLKQIYAWRAVRLPALVIGALVSVLVCVFFFGDNKLVDLPDMLQYGVAGGLLGGLWSRPVEDLGKQGGHRHRWRKLLVQRLAISACIGVIDGLCLGLHLSSYSHYTLSQWLPYALSYGVMVGLSILLLQYLLTRPFYPGTSSRNSALRRFWSAVQGPRVLLVTILNGLLVQLSIASFYELSLGLRVGLSFGLIYGLISLALSAQMEDIRPTERLRWSWRSLRRGLFSSRHLGITALLTGISMIFFVLSRGLSRGLSQGLSVGLSSWCLLGLYQGIAQERIEDQDRRVANQGIHRSLRNSVMMGLIGGALIGSIGILSYWLTVRLNDMLNYVLSSVQKSEQISMLSYVLNYGLVLGICGALLIALLTGGLAVLRHCTIRSLLSRSHTFPGRAPQFLDDSCARFLLRRVGGGYSFAHRLLLDHLADAATTPTTAASSLPLPHPEQRGEERSMARSDSSAHAPE
jgi:serine/threonine protein kinase